MIQVSGTTPSWLVTPEKVELTIRRIVEHCHPEQVILFGSYARGQTNRDSDLDVLVVTREPVGSPSAASVRIRDAIGDVSMAVDVLVVSRERLEQIKDIPGLIYREALQTGKIAYDATRQATRFA